MHRQGMEVIDRPTAPSKARTRGNARFDISAGHLDYP